MILSAIPVENIPLLQRVNFIGSVKLGYELLTILWFVIQLSRHYEQYVRLWLCDGSLLCSVHEMEHHWSWIGPIEEIGLSDAELMASEMHRSPEAWRRQTFIAISTLCDCKEQCWATYPEVLVLRRIIEVKKSLTPTIIRGHNHLHEWQHEDSFEYLCEWNVILFVHLISGCLVL